MFFKESGRHDLNVRPPAPKAGALAKLSYAPRLWCLTKKINDQLILPSGSSNTGSSLASG